MAARWFLLLSASLVTAGVLGMGGAATTEAMKQLVVRLAELEIEPAQLEAYKAALRKEIAASIRVEPGVLTYMPYRSRITLHKSGSSKPMRIRLLTKHTGRLPTFRNIEVKPRG